MVFPLLVFGRALETAGRCRPRRVRPGRAAGSCGLLCRGPVTGVTKAVTPTVRCSPVPAALVRRVRHHRSRVDHRSPPCPFARRASGRAGGDLSGGESAELPALRGSGSPRADRARSAVAMGRTGSDRVDGGEVWGFGRSWAYFRSGCDRSGAYFERSGCLCRSARGSRPAQCARAARHRASSPTARFLRRLGGRVVGGGMCRSHPCAWSLCRHNDPVRPTHVQP